MRYRLAYDRGTVTLVLGAFLRAVFASLRRRAREQHGAVAADGKCGAVTVIQRAGGAGNLNVHFHVLVLDGIYAVPPHGRKLRFLELAAPSSEALTRVLADTAGRVARALTRGRQRTTRLGVATAASWLSQPDAVGGGFRCPLYRLFSAA